MAGVIFDASAVLALLRDEPGAEKVTNLLNGARMSVVNHAEVVSYYARIGADHEAIDGMLRALPVELVPVDRKLASAAGLLRAVTVEAGLPLGNRFCLALVAREEGRSHRGPGVEGRRRRVRREGNDHPLKPRSPPFDMPKRMQAMPCHYAPADEKVADDLTVGRRLEAERD